MGFRRETVRCMRTLRTQTKLSKSTVKRQRSPGGGRPLPASSLCRWRLTPHITGFSVDAEAGSWRYRIMRQDESLLRYQLGPAWMERDLIRHPVTLSHQMQTAP